MPNNRIGPQSWGPFKGLNRWNNREGPAKEAFWLPAVRLGRLWWGHSSCSWGSQCPWTWHHQGPHNPSSCATTILSLHWGRAATGWKKPFCCSVAQSCSTLRPHGLQHTRLFCPSLSPYSNSCPLSLWCHPTISSSVWSRRMISEAEEWISELEDRLVEITAEEQNKGKRLKSTENSLRDLWDNIKCIKVWIIGVPEEE